VGDGACQLRGDAHDGFAVPLDDVDLTRLHGREPLPRANRTQRRQRCRRQPGRGGPSVANRPRRPAHAPLAVIGHALARLGGGQVELEDGPADVKGVAGR
jgi:hypothetical protein